MPDGINPGGGGNHAPDMESPKQSPDTTFPRVSRLTPERPTKMNIGTNFLSPEEKQLFIDILFKYERAIAFDDSEISLLHPEIEPPVVIHTVPRSPWQQQTYVIPKRCKKPLPLLSQTRERDPRIFARIIPQSLLFGQKEG